MKTNHQRNFRDSRAPRQVYAKYFVGGNSVYSEMADRIISACATSGDHTNGKRGIAKDKRGAKKFVNSRTRFHENAATARLAKSAGLAED